MKFKVTVKETVLKTIEVDTINFDINLKDKNKEVFETAELINEIKNDGQKFIRQFKKEVEECVYLESVKVNFVE